MADKVVIMKEENNSEELDEEVEMRPRNHQKKWTPEEEERLIGLLSKGVPFDEIADKHQRRVGGIEARMILLYREGRLKGKEVTSSSGSGEPPNNPKTGIAGDGIPPNRPEDHEGDEGGYCNLCGRTCKCPRDKYQF